MAWTSTKFTGSGALAVTFEPDVAFMLEQIRLTVSAKSPLLESFTCVLDSAAGSQYDADFMNISMQDTKSIVCFYGKETKFAKGDKLIFAWDNSDSLTWGLEIRTMRLC